MWCDNGNVNSSNFPNFGGNYDNGDNAGLFNVNFNNSATNTSSNVGSRTSIITLQPRKQTERKSPGPCPSAKNQETPGPAPVPPKGRGKGTHTNWRALQMKRIRHIDGIELYDIIRSRENVVRAVKAACRDHAKDPAVIRIREDPGPYVEAVCGILDGQTFHYSRFKRKRIFERGKWRELCYTRTFPDRIVQHAVMQVVAPILLGTCTRDTYAAMEGRGLHAGSMRLRRALREDPHGTRFCLKIDVHHYFPSIDRRILFDLVRRKIRCPRTLSIIETMIFGCPGSGLPIGLYSSQIFSTYYLSKFDHYCKERLGLSHYFRYMDDIVVMGYSKWYLRNVLRFMRSELERYGLAVKANWQVFPTDSRGVDFLGFVHRHTHTRVRKRNKVAYRRACNHIVGNIRRHRPVTSGMIASVISYESFVGWADAKRLVTLYSGRVDTALEFGAEALK